MEAIVKKNVTFIDISKKIFFLALPIAGRQFINAVSGFLCMAMLAQLGHEVLAASALIFSIQFSIMVNTMSLLSFLSVLVGHAYGAGNYLFIGKLVQQSWMLALLISIPVIIFFWHIGSIVTFLGQPEEIAKIVQTYFHAYVWGVVPGFLSTCNQQFAYGIHKKGFIVLLALISAVLLLMTAYVLIFGKLGIQKMGVAGLGYAMSLQYVFFFISTSLFFYYEKSFRCFELFKYRANKHRDPLVRPWMIGWPVCIQMGGEMLSSFWGGMMIGWLGTTTLAAFQIVNQYYFLIVIPIISLSQASSILVGHARGARQFYEIKKLSYASVFIVFIASLMVAAAFFLFPKRLASLYMDVSNSVNADTLHLTILIFMIIAFTQMWDGLRNTLVGILHGLFDTRFPMWMSLSTIWLVSMPLSYILAFSLHLGAKGYFMGGMLGALAGAVMTMYRWHKLMRMNGE